MHALLILAVVTCGAASTEAASEDCAACHPAIYKSYMRTAMALSSGRVGAGVFQEKFEGGEFSHALSGVRYRVYRDANQPLFSFDFSAAGTRIHGTRPLEYFIGSETVSRSYLFSVEGFIYQAPVSYYSAESRWGLSPGYERYDRLYLSRPVEAAVPAMSRQPFAADRRHAEWVRYDSVSRRRSRVRTLPWPR